MANSIATRSASRSASSKTFRPIPEYIWFDDDRTLRTRMPRAVTADDSRSRLHGLDLVLQRGEPPGQGHVIPAERDRGVRVVGEPIVPDLQVGQVGAERSVFPFGRVEAVADRLQDLDLPRRSAEGAAGRPASPGRRSAGPPCGARNRRCRRPGRSCFARSIAHV